MLQSPVACSPALIVTPLQHPLSCDQCHLKTPEPQNNSSDPNRSIYQRHARSSLSSCRSPSQGGGVERLPPLHGRASKEEEEEEEEEEE